MIEAELAKPTLVLKQKTIQKQSETITISETIPTPNDEELTKSQKKHKNYGRETRYNKKKNEFSLANPKEITVQQEALLIPLTKFFKDDGNITRILPILKGQSPVSLRIMDWFVTNYSKQKGTVYNLAEMRQNKNNDGETPKKSVVANFDDLFFVHSDYRCRQLKSFSKNNFDPFCRGTKIQFDYNEDKFIITTVGQLNFFRWAIKNHVLDYIEQHLEDIEDHMNNNIKATMKNNDKDDEDPLNLGQTQKRRKRKEISPSAVKSITKYNSPVIINFN